MCEPIIVTACFDSSSQKRLDTLRELFFPPGKTVIAAHLTLFHAIPAEYLAQVREAVARFCCLRGPISVSLPAVYSLGRGVAIRVESTELLELRSALAAPLQNVLSPQDAQGFRPHVTIANKLSVSDAKALLRSLEATWGPVAARLEALAVWRYLGPHWRLDRRETFRAT